MTTAFTSASDTQVVELIKRARRRLALIAPAFSSAVAEALAARMEDLPSLSPSLLLDADLEVYRMGYGEVEALDIIRPAAATCSFRLFEQGEAASGQSSFNLLGGGA